MDPKPEDPQRKPPPLDSANIKNSSISGSETSSETSDEDYSIRPLQGLSAIPENTVKPTFAQEIIQDPEQDPTLSSHAPHVPSNLDDKIEGSETRRQSIDSEFVPYTPGTGHSGGRTVSNYSPSIASTINGDWRRRSINRAASTIGSFTSDFEKAGYERPTKAWLARNEGKNEEFQRRLTEEEMKRKSRLNSIKPPSIPRTPVRNNSRMSPTSHESSRFLIGWNSQSRIPRTPNFSGKKKDLGYFDSEHGGYFHQDPVRSPPQFDKEVQAMKEMAKGSFQDCIWMNTELQAISQRNRKSEGKTHQKIISMQSRLRDILTGREDKEAAKRSMEEVEEVTRDVEEDLRRLKNDLEEVQRAKEILEEELRQERFNRQLAGQRVEELTSEKETRAREMTILERNLEELKASHGNMETDEIVKLQQDLAAAKQAMAQNSTDTAEYMDILMNSEKNDLAMLRVRTGELVDEYAAKLSALEKELDSLRHELAKRDQEFHDLEKNHQIEIEKLQNVVNSRAVTPSPLDLNSENSKGNDIYKKMVADKNTAYQKLQKEYEKLRSIQFRFDGPKLKQQTEDLKGRLTAVTDKYRLAVQETEQWKDKASNWKHEHESLKERFQLSSNEYDDKLRSVQEEMAQIIKEYQDHLPDKDPKWWDINALQKEVRKRESELDDLAKESHRLRTERDQAVNKFQEARDAMEAGRAIRYTSPRSGIKPKPIREPRCESEEEMRMRKQAIEDFKKDQKRRRGHLTAKDKLIEDARQYKMGSRFPPDQPGYKKLASKDAYERWEAKAFKKDRDVAARLVANAVDYS